MIHYSCDRCKQELNPHEDVRYVVNVEAYPAMNSLESDEMEDDRDYLAEIQEVLERVADCDVASLSNELYKRHQYDLCPECYKQFVRNPLGRELVTQLNFSHN